MVQKKRGRPRKLDPDQALTAIIDVFWEYGYDGASTDILAKAAGATKPSLYAAFGDKQALFQKALERYALTISGQATEAFLTTTPIQAAVNVYFDTALKNATRPDTNAKGCLIASSAMASVNALPDIRDTLHGFMQRGMDRIANRFDDEKAQGTLLGSFDSASKAALMVELMHGQANRARLGFDPESLAMDIPVKTKAVLGL